MPTRPLAALALAGLWSATALAQVPDAFVSATENRFNQLERQVIDLTGRLERLEIQIRQLTQRMERLQGDLELRFTELEQQRQAPQQQTPTRRETPQRETPQRGRNTGPTPPTPPAAPAAPGVPRAPRSSEAPADDVQVFPAGNRQPGEPRFVLERGPPGRQLGVQADDDDPPAQPARPVQRAARGGTAEQDYEEAYEAVRDVTQGRGSAAEAARAMREFADAHPRHRLAVDARFWEGDMLYRQRNYTEAQAVLAGLIQAQPNSARAPEAMLRLAQSMRAGNQNEQACGLLSLIPQRYPRASQRVKDDAQQERRRRRCPA